MSLPIAAIDRLFARLLGTYGSEFRNRYAGIPDGELKSIWAHELAAFATEDGLRAIAWALSNLPERCPNVIELRALARTALPAPKPTALAEPEPAADPERLRAEFAKLLPLREAIIKNGPAPRLEWARRILARQDSGAKVSPTVLGMARSALRMQAEV